MRFGLDFGTSNSALAVSDDGAARLLPLDPIAGSVMPSVLYIRRDGSVVVGRSAIDRYLADRAVPSVDARSSWASTGGSSAIPAFRALLTRRFPDARLRDADPYGSVAAGLALSER